MITLTAAPKLLSGLGRGTVLDRYELLEPIASGGMADVWLGRAHGDFSFERLVAVKILKPELTDHPAVRAMFLREGKLTAKIRHPNVVEALDLGEADGLLYQVLEYVEGMSLRAVESRAGRLPAPVVARIVADALCGLHAAHELSDDAGSPLHLVHRDVSPQNILVRLDGRALIADFGVAKAIRSRAETDMTKTGELRGKLGYMAPEQLLGGDVDRRADVFAMGVVLWEGLTGRRLLGGESAVASLWRLEAEGIPHPATLDRSLEGLVAADVAMCALQRSPSMRFASADAMAAALEAGGCATSREVSDAIRPWLSDDVVALVARARGGPASRPRGREPSRPSRSEVVARQAAPGGLVDARPTHVVPPSASGERAARGSPAVRGSAAAILVASALVAAWYAGANQAPGAGFAPAATPSSSAEVAPAAPTPSSIPAPHPEGAPTGVARESAAAHATSVPPRRLPSAAAPLPAQRAARPVAAPVQSAPPPQVSSAAPLHAPPRANPYE